jgi:hypothetical protein
VCTSSFNVEEKVGILHTECIYGSCFDFSINNDYLPKRPINRLNFKQRCDVSSWRRQPNFYALSQLKVTKVCVFRFVGAIPLLPPCASMACSGTAFLYFTLLTLHVCLSACKVENR